MYVEGPLSVPFLRLKLTFLLAVLTSGQEVAAPWTRGLFAVDHLLELTN